jgi:hypothetical protein
MKAFHFATNHLFILFTSQIIVTWAMFFFFVFFFFEEGKKKKKKPTTGYQGTAHGIRESRLRQSTIKYMSIDIDNSISQTTFYQIIH